MSLPFKIHAAPVANKAAAKGKLLATAAHAEDAAAIVSAQGDGASIWYMGVCVWREGAETFPAGESYDAVAEVIHSRIDGSEGES